MKRLFALLLLLAAAGAANALNVATCSTAVSGTIVPAAQWLPCSTTVTYLPAAPNLIVTVLRGSTVQWLLASQAQPADGIWTDTVNPNGSNTSWWAVSALITANAWFSATTPPPVVSGTGAVTVSWVAPTQNTDGSALTDLAGYFVYEGSASTSLTKVNTTAMTATTYTASGLTSGNYFYTVTAVNSAGVESTQPTPVEATVTIVKPPLVPGSPTGISVTVSASIH